MSFKTLLCGVAMVCVSSAAFAAETGCTFEPRIPTSRYEMKGDEVYDTKTNLTWARCSIGQKWADGQGCMGEAKMLSLKDAKDTPRGWRLPTKDELLGLMSDACLKSINTDAFPGVSRQQPTFWSATETDPGLTWIVNLTTGADFNALQSSTNAVKLVRTGR